MKTPKKPTRKIATKGPASGDSKKSKMKPVNSKETKNWKKRVLDDEDDDFDLEFEEDFDEFDDFDSYDDDDGRF
ncbi:MAG TPA: hypothetical protein VIR29_09405 [Anseongella sp.]